jgi:hypothetical protein
MERAPHKRLSTAYAVVAVVFALMMSFSASGKLMQMPPVVKGIHETVGVPLGLFPVLATLQIAGAIGLLAGIVRPKLGVIAAGAFVLYFAGAIVAHVNAGDWPGLRAPIVPLLLAITAFMLRRKSLPSTAPA